MSKVLDKLDPAYFPPVRTLKDMTAEEKAALEKIAYGPLEQDDMAIARAALESKEPSEKK